MKHCLCILCLLGTWFQVPAQKVLKLNLEQAIEIANDSSYLLTDTKTNICQDIGHIGHTKPTDFLVLR